MPRSKSSHASPLLLVEDEPCVLDVLTRAARGWNFGAGPRLAPEDAVAAPGSPADSGRRHRSADARQGRLTAHRRDPWRVARDTGHRRHRHRGRGTAEPLSAGRAPYFFLKLIKLDEFHNALQFALPAIVCNHGSHGGVAAKLERQLIGRTQHLRSNLRLCDPQPCLTLEARDPSTAQHSIRVRHLAGGCAGVARNDGEACSESGWQPSSKTSARSASLRGI